MPNYNDIIELSDHNINLEIKKNYINIIGEGNYLLNKDYDQINYNLTNKNNNYLVKTKVKFKKNRLIFKLLDYQKPENKNSFLDIDFVIKKNNFIYFKNILFEESENKFLVKDLNFDDSLKIIGGRQLNGQIKISGAKNAALPLMACGLLIDKGNLEIDSMPNLADTKFMCILLESLGIKAKIINNIAYFSGDPSLYVAKYDIVRKMRASILVLGPLLARVGIAKVSLPGGCSIGTRPVDLHIQALERMGATINLINGYIEAKAPKNGLQGTEIKFPKISVGATENIIMAASLANGKTKIYNAAKEPEIIDLANCLNSMGAQINGPRSHRHI